MKKDNKQKETLYELAEKGNNHIGTFVKRKEEIETLPEYWMDFKEINNLPAKDVLRDLLNKDETLTGIVKRGISQEKLERILEVDNLFKDYKEVKEALDIMSEGKLYSNQDYIAVLINRSTEPSDDRGWDVRIQRSRVYVINDGKIYTKELEPYWVYEDFPGGQTYEYDERKLIEIVDVKKQGKAFEIKARNKKGDISTISLEDFVEFGFGNKAKKTIESLIKEKEKEWLSYGNLNIIAIKTDEGYEGTYPYSINYKIDKTKKEAYIAVTKVIDMERYDELLINGLKQGRVYDPQLDITIYRVSLKDIKNPEIVQIHQETTNRRSIPFLDAYFSDKRIFFGLDNPEMVMDEDSVGVRIKFRKSQDKWITKEYKTKR